MLLHLSVAWACTPPTPVRVIYTHKTHTSALIDRRTHTHISTDCFSVLVPWSWFSLQRSMTKEILLSTFHLWIKYVGSKPWPQRRDAELCVYLSAWDESAAITFCNLLWEPSDAVTNKVLQGWHFYWFIYFLILLALKSALPWLPQQKATFFFIPAE